MDQSYVNKTASGFRVSDTRVSLDSVVYAFLDGQTPEAIAQCFPTLTLEQVYGAITFYLHNRAEIDEYLKAGEADHEAKRQAAKAADPAFYERMAATRKSAQSTP